MQPMQDTIYFDLFVDKSDTSMQWEEGEGGSREGECQLAN